MNNSKKKSDLLLIICIFSLFSYLGFASTPPDVSEYSINTISGGFIDISGSGTSLSLSPHQGISNIPLEFDFVFYGLSYNTMLIAPDGYITFSGIISDENSPFPSADLPDNMIAPFWDSLDPTFNSGSGIYFTTIGTPPHRQCIVQWDEISLEADPGSSLTFEVILFEGSNEIQFQYLSMTDSLGQAGTGGVSGKSASIGIENNDASRGTEISFNREGVVWENRAFSLTQGGNAFEQGQMLGDLNNDKAITILDQSLLTDVILGQDAPYASPDLLLSDIAPVPGTGTRAFGDGKIDSLDHQRLFQVIMGRGSLNPVLSGLSLRSGFAGETLGVYGSGFAAILNHNIIVFTTATGATTSTLPDAMNADGTELSVIIPSGSDFITSVHVVKKDLAGNELASNNCAFVLENIPVITLLSPAAGEAGERVRIKGYEFGLTPEDNIVRFNGIEAEVLSSASQHFIDELVVTVPAGADTGPVTVTTNSQTSNGVIFTVDGPPVVAITSPIPGSEITAPTEITGTASDLTLTSYTLAYAPAGDSVFTPLGAGTSSVVNGVLGTIDPTMMLNGLYSFRLTATDSEGHSSSVTETYRITGDMKVGNFSIAFSDLSIPVSGLPITINRTYDSRDKRSHDFGYAWNIDILTTKVEENSILGEGWVQTSAGSIIPVYYLSPAEEKYVTITLPNGKMEEFDVAITPESSVLLPYSTAVDFSLKFVPRTGTTSSLRLASSELLLFSPPNILDMDTFEPYDPNRYILTTSDGSEYVIDENLGLLYVKEPNGNSLSINSNGIIHSSGKSITFSRDTHGRITHITDPLGNTLEYGYDSRGDLVSFTDQEGNTTTYTYNLSHGLIDIVDPLGRRAVRNEYDDDGRIIAHIDAEGNRIEFTHDPDTRQEIVRDRLGHVTLLGYDANGLIVSKTDSLGNTTSYAYDGNKNKTSETDALGRTTVYTYDSKKNKLTETVMSDGEEVTLSWTYDSQGRMLSQTDALGNTETYTYDSRGNRISTTDSLGNTTATAFDASGNLSSLTDVNGNITSFEYDGYGNQTKTIYPDGNVYTYTYDQNGNMLTLTDAMGNTTYYTYDSMNRLLSIRDPAGIRETTEYDAAGNVIAETDALGNRTLFTYNASNKLIKTTYPDNTTTTGTYDAEGNRLTSTDQSGRTTTYGYDARNQLIRITYPDGSTLRFTYDAIHRRIAVTDALGNTLTTGYDDMDNPVVKTDALGNSFTSTFDINNNEITRTDANNNTTGFTYDENNQLIRTTYADGTFTENTYDSFGNLIASMDQAGNSTTIVYDMTGHPIRVIQEMNGTQLVTEYGYDADGNLILQRDAKGNETHFEYNHMGLETARILPDGSRETSVYDASGNLIQKTDFMGRATTYTYDSMNRLITKTYPDDTGVLYTYTATGKVHTSANTEGTTLYTYDNMDRLIGIAYPNGTSIAYTYDLNGNRLSMTCSIPGVAPLTTTYAYNPLNRLTTVTDPLSRNYQYTYDNNGNRSTLRFPNNTRTTYSYDTLNRLTDLMTVYIPGNTTIQSYAFTLGIAGNRTRIDENLGLSRERTIHYAYDALHRLTGENIRMPDNTLLYEKTFSYDPVGNRELEITTTGPEAPVALVSGPSSSSFDSRDRLVAKDSQAYSWDVNGNLISKDEDAVFTWDYENRLISFEDKDGTLCEYGYNADGIRIRSTTTIPGQEPLTVHYLVDAAQALPSVVAEIADEGNLAAYYVRGTDLLSVMRPDVSAVSGWQTRYYHADGTDSVRVLTDEDGAITDTYTYTAFGERIDHSYTGSAPDPQPYAFNSEPLDPNSHFQYHRARWLDPGNGRFTSMDIFRGTLQDPRSLHAYAYAGNNPVMYFDPSGLVSSMLLGTFIHQHIIGMYPGPTLGGKMIPGFTSVLFPDIADVALKQVIEIKPLSPYGVATGYVQLATYIAALNAVGKTNPYIGTGWTFGLWSPAIGLYTEPITSSPYLVVGNYGGVLFYRVATARLYKKIYEKIAEKVKKFAEEAAKKTQQQAQQLAYALSVMIFSEEMKAIIAIALVGIAAMAMIYFAFSFSFTFAFI